jgi:hypothetical protein
MWARSCFLMFSGPSSPRRSPTKLGSSPRRSQSPQHVHASDPSRCHRCERSGRSSDLDRNAFQLGVVMKGIDTFFPTNATLLVTAKRRLDATGEILVYKDLSGF